MRIGRVASVAVGGRALVVRLRCPRALRSGCAGRLALSLAGRGLGGARYARIRRGRSRVVSVALSAGEARALRAGGRVRAVARERDRIGRDKLTIRALPLIHRKRLG